MRFLINELKEKKLWKKNLFAQMHCSVRALFMPDSLIYSAGIQFRKKIAVITIRLFLSLSLNWHRIILREMMHDVICEQMLSPLPVFVIRRSIVHSSLYAHVHHYGVVAHFDLNICILRRLHLCRLALNASRKNAVILLISIFSFFFSFCC